MPTVLPIMILVLGSMYDDLQNIRMDVAVDLFKTTPNAYITFSGNSKNEVHLRSTEGARMLRQALGENIDAALTFTDMKSTNTAENAVCSALLWESGCVQPEKVVVVTNEFHLPRAKHIFNVLWADKPWTTEWLAAPDPNDVNWREDLERVLMENIEIDVETARRKKCARFKTCANVLSHRRRLGRLRL